LNANYFRNIKSNVKSARSNVKKRKYIEKSVLSIEDASSEGTPRKKFQSSGTQSEDDEESGPVDHTDRIYLGNIDENTTEEQVAEFLSRAGI
jgi:RNA recognition motif-containing protein